ncbi:MAG: M56 family metallopeptidase [Candidatus Acidiferrales bacterium]|jgi:beta-lactamase regulating signal transducer with metallopeptidase domain
MAPAIIHASTSFLAGLASAAARSLVLGCFAAAALGAFRIRSVRVKLLGWRAVLFAALAMPVLILLSPAVWLPVPLPSLQKQSAAAEVGVAQPAAAPLAVPAAGPGSGLQTATHTDERAALAQTAIVTKDEPGVASIPARREVPWPVVAASAYLAVALILFVRFFIGMKFGRRLERAATAIENAHALQLLFEVSRAAGLRAAPRLAESEMLAVPLMLGASDPVILFPPEWRTWDEDELAAVLAHEVSHVKRRDALMQRLALIHRAIFWFSPLAWWIERQLTELAEQASDEAALEGGVDRTRYAEALLGFFAELEAAPERVWWQGVSMAKAGQAEKRVERILAWRGAMSNKLTKSLVVALAVIVMPVVALTASLHPSVLDVQEPASPAAPQAPAIPAQPGLNPTPGSTPPPAPMAPAPPAMPAVPVSAPPLAAPSVPAVPQVPPVAPVQAPSTEPAPSPVPMPAPAPAAPAPPDSWEALGNYFGHLMGGYYYGWGPRFAIVAKDSDRLMMSGSEEDAEHAKSLRSKIPGDFIWFERDEKSYVIRDPATVDRAKKLWEPQQDLGKSQETYAKQQEDLRKMEDELRKKMEDVRVKVPDLSADIEKLQADVKKLNESGATMQQFGDLQREIGEMQRRLGEINWDAVRQQTQLGMQQGDLGRKMGELGRQQGEIARQQVERARQAAREMKELLDDAIARGLAQPE